jgi:hypothetical protein
MLLNCDFSTKSAWSSIISICKFSGTLFTSASVGRANIANVESLFFSRQTLYQIALLVPSVHLHNNYMGYFYELLE